MLIGRYSPIDIRQNSEVAAIRTSNSATQYGGSGFSVSTRAGVAALVTRFADSLVHPIGDYVRMRLPRVRRCAGLAALHALKTRKSHEIGPYRRLHHVRTLCIMAITAKLSGFE